MTKSAASGVTVGLASYAAAVTLLQLFDSRALAVIVLSASYAFICFKSIGTTRSAADTCICMSLVAAFLVQNLYALVTIPIVVGPDEERFFWNFYLYEADRLEYLKNALSRLIESRFILSGSYDTFGLLVYPLFGASGEYREELMPLLNLSLIISALWIATSQAADHRLKIALLACAISPSILYHANIFSKDVLVLSLSLACFYVLKDRRYLAAGAFLAFATAFRPYSMVVVAIYYASFILKPRFVVAGSLLSLTLVGFFIGLVGIGNSLITSLYLIVSPNPLEFSFERPDYLLLYFEALMLGCVTFGAVAVALANPPGRTAVVTFICGLLVYGAVMALLGKYGSEAYGFDYGIGTMGGNVVRKKLMIVPFVYVCVIWFLHRYPAAKVRN